MRMGRVLVEWTLHFTSFEKKMAEYHDERTKGEEREKEKWKTKRGRGGVFKGKDQKLHRSHRTGKKKKNDSKGEKT